jgi:PAS domain-containing protein
LLVRKQNEQALRESETRFARWLKRLPMPSLRSTRQHIIYINHAAEKFLV